MLASCLALTLAAAPAAPASEPPLGPTYDDAIEIVAPEPPHPAPEPEPILEPAEPKPEPEPEPPPLVRDRLGCTSAPCRNMAAAGITVGTLSLSALGVGIGLILRPDQVIDERPAFVMSTHPAGVVMVTISSAVTITAALMLAAAYQGDAGRSGRRKTRARVQPTLTGFRF